MRSLFNMSNLQISTYEKSRLVQQPRQQRSREALARIVAAAELLLRTKGYDGFSMGALAALAGMPTGNIYRRFRGKAELLLALKENATDRIEQAVAAALSGNTLSTIDGVVQVTTDAIVSGFAKDEKLHRALFSDTIGDPSMSKAGRTGRSRIFVYYRDALRPLLTNLPIDKAELITRVSFEIIASSLVGKARSDSENLKAVPWPILNQEIVTATVAYLKSCRDSEKRSGHSGAVRRAKNSNTPR